MPSSHHPNADHEKRTTDGLAIEEILITADDGGHSTLTHVRADPDAGGNRRTPIIMLPGMFSGRGFWLSDKGIGLAAYLASCGFDVWIVQRRGVGTHQRANRSAPREGLEEHLRFDLPLIQKHVYASNPNPAFWIGHSFGGVMAARAAAKHLDPAPIAGLVLFATQVEVGKASLVPPGSWLTLAMTWLVGYCPAKKAGLGPLNETLAAMSDAAKLTTMARRNPAVLAPLKNISAPVLALVGKGDTVDPSAGCRMFFERLGSTDKQFMELSEAANNLMDYNHPGIVVSKQAQREVWPLVADWLSKHSHTN